MAENIPYIMRRRKPYKPRVRMSPGRMVDLCIKLNDGTKPGVIAEALGVSVSAVYHTMKFFLIVEPTTGLYMVADQTNRMVINYKKPISVTVPFDSVNYFKLLAKEREVSVEALISKILSTIAKDNLYKAVVDDD